MKIRSIDELVSFIQKDLTNRKKDIFNIKSAYKDYKVNAQKKNLITKASILLFYSHWEGFVKYSSNCYLQYVKSKNLNYSELNSSLFALATKQLYFLSLKTNKTKFNLELISLHREKKTEKAELLSKAEISTNSNLNFEQLENICDSLNISIKNFEPYKSFIEEILLSNRNGIAHGEYRSLIEFNFEKFHSKILELLELYNNEILNLACTENYKYQGDN